LHPHQYIHRRSGRVITEVLFADRLIHWLYGAAREKAPLLFKALTSARSSRLLSHVNFDAGHINGPAAARRLAVNLGIDLSECVWKRRCLVSPRHLFERQIKYWTSRPTPKDQNRVVSPADANVLVGSMEETDRLFIKEKFFTFVELLGEEKIKWCDVFRHGDFAAFRLTPEKYHYNHTPVSGRVVDYYTVDGDYHSCNPKAAVSMVTPYSKNKRVVTVFDTDIEGGTGVGLVAMIEVVALMIGDIVQCYSEQRYDDPQPIAPGLEVRRGQPKSLFRPGSSVDVLLFQKGRIAFDQDLVDNRFRSDAVSRYSLGFGRPVVETGVRVRESIARRKDRSDIISERVASGMVEES
jgi:phosphatidylserine decarboxylase